MEDPRQKEPFEGQLGSNILLATTKKYAVRMWILDYIAGESAANGSVQLLSLCEGEIWALDETRNDTPIKWF